MKFLLISFFLTYVLNAQKLDTVYVNHETGDDSRKSITAEKPLKTFSKALALVKESGTVIIQKTKSPYTEQLHVNVGGTAQKPLKVIGSGAVIDLSTDISKGPWKKDGDFYIFDQLIKRNLKGSGLHQLAALWVDKTPVHPYYHKLKQKHFVTYLEDGRMKVKFPEGMDPLSGKHRILLNADFGQSTVSFGNNASHIIIDGLTVKHSGNDGFNLHGSSKGIHLTNVISLFNADEGISAHGHLEMLVTNSIIGHNGSAAGGIADVGECVTEYRNCIVFNNYNCAFYFSAKKHKVSNCIVWGNRKTLAVRKEADVSTESIHEYKNLQEAQLHFVKFSPALQKVMNRLLIKIKTF